MGKVAIGAAAVVVIGGAAYYVTQNGLVAASSSSSSTTTSSILSSSATTTSSTLSSSATMISSTGLATPTIGMQGPYVDNLTFSIILESANQILALKNGSVDLIYNPLTSPTDISNMQGVSNVNVALPPSTNVLCWMFFNERTAPMSDLNFRQAVAYAIGGPSDKQAILNPLWGSNLYTATGNAELGSLWGQWSTPPIVFSSQDIAKANALLDSSGYAVGSDGFRTNTDGSAMKISILTDMTLRPVSLLTTQLVAQFLSNNLKVNFVAQGIDYATWIGTMFGTHDYQMGLGLARLALNDPWYHYLFFQPSSADPMGIGANPTYSQQFSDLYTKFTTADQADAIQACYGIQQFFGDSLLFYNWGYFSYGSAYRTDRLTGWANQASYGVSGDFGIEDWAFWNVRNLDGTFGGSLTVATANDLQSNNPYTSAALEINTATYLNLIYSTLLTNTTPTMADGSIASSAPSLASSWTVQNVNSTTQTLTFNLQKNVKWHDGQPFSSDDVVWTINALQAQPQAAGIHLPSFMIPEISDVTNPDENTVIVTMNNNSPFNIRMVGYLDILPKHLLEGQDLTAEFDKVVGTGPFVWDSWTPGTSLNLTANKSYFAYPQVYSGNRWAP